jgi:hypothetical protein
MNKQRTFSRTLLAMAIAALGASGTALAQEANPNNDIGTAQVLQLGSVGGASVTVNGAIGSDIGDTVVPDADFYSFHANVGDTIEIDIDGGVGGLGHVNTLLTLFGPNGDWLTENDDVLTPDPGTIHEADARIDKYVIRVTGTYTVAVTGAPVAFVPFVNGANYKDGVTMPESNGDYTLTIVRLTVPEAPAVKYISIDVKPGSKEFVHVNPKARGVVPVALLSANGFTAPVDVKRSSLTFGASGNEASLTRCNKESKDVDGDGLPDLVCYFELHAANFSPQHTKGILKGTTNGGSAIEGHGSLKVIPVKRNK